MSSDSNKQAVDLDLLAARTRELQRVLKVAAAWDEYAVKGWSEPLGLPLAVMTREIQHSLSLRMSVAVSDAHAASFETRLKGLIAVVESWDTERKKKPPAVQEPSEPFSVMPGSPGLAARRAATDVANLFRHWVDRLANASERWLLGLDDPPKVALWETAADLREHPKMQIRVARCLDLLCEELDARVSEPPLLSGSEKHGDKNAAPPTPENGTEPAFRRRERAVLRVLRDRGPGRLATVEALAEASGLSPRTVSTAIRRLWDLNLIEYPHGPMEGCRLKTAAIMKVARLDLNQ